MEKVYVAVDVETAGPFPDMEKGYSMLSLGACIVGNRSRTFYRELKPLNHNFVPGAMRVGSLDLRCLDNKFSVEYDPKHSKFEPRKVLDVLAEEGVTPEAAMSDFAEWVNRNTLGRKAIELAAPIKFDAMFTAYYFGMFYPEANPLGHSGEDINSFYRGVMRDRNASISQLNLRPESGLPHNALADAQQQAREFEKVLELAGIIL
jgi:ribonuclease T